VFVLSAHAEQGHRRVGGVREGERLSHSTSACFGRRCRQLVPV
jgi:hypothetical protein